MSSLLVYCTCCIHMIVFAKLISLRRFEDTKWVIRSCKSKKDRQCNDQKKKDKSTNKDLQNTTQKED
jgi:hypothetical protein